MNRKKALEILSKHVAPRQNVSDEHLLLSLVEVAGCPKDNGIHYVQENHKDCKKCWEQALEVVE